MKIEEMQGKTLGYISRRHSFHIKGWRIFSLRDKHDTTGTQIATEFDLKRVLRERPALKRAKVISAEDYYGVILLRVREGR